MRLDFLALALGVAISGACQSTVPGTTATEPTMPSAPSTSLAYSRAQSSGELAALLDRDLPAGATANAYEGLEAFVSKCVTEDHEAWGHALFAELKPAWRMQVAKAHKFITPVQNLSDLLRGGAERAVRQAQAALDRGDLGPVEQAASDSRSFLAAGVRPHLPDPLAADFLAAMLESRDLNRSGRVELTRASEVAQRFDVLASALDRQGRTEDALLVQIGAAQVLDLAGATDEALDRWLSISGAKPLAHADAIVQIAVARRIRSFRDRLRDELTNSIRAEEKARVDGQLQALREEMSKLSVDKQAEIQQLQREMDELEQRAATEKAEAVGLQRTLYGDMLDRQVARISSLESRLVDLATVRRESGTQFDWNSVNSAQSALGTTVDVLSLWQMARSATRSSSRL